MRQSLRRSTEESHEALDLSLGSLDLSDRDGYARFLSVQYAARQMIEAWVDLHCPAALKPPPQTHMIADDLARLDRPRPVMAPSCQFEAPHDGALGIAWALGGSSMGNRLMARRVEEGKSGLPVTFLSDGGMADFFRRIRSRLDQPATGEPTLAGSTDAAQSVFAIFATMTALLAPSAEQAA